MKKFKKLIPALCMLLVSAVMLGGTTFAWFSMNNKVTATGMTVTATANTQFLVISNSETLASETELTATKKSGGSGDGTTVYPCAKVTETDLANTKFQGKSLNMGDWYTANSTKYDDAATTGSNYDNITNVTKLTDMDKYHIVYEFYIGLAAGSNDYTGDLVIANTETLAAATKAIVKVGDNEITLTSTTSSQTLSSVTLTTTATKVTVTLYVDGNDDSIKSQGATTITGNLNLSFTANGITVA